ncbi:hypothetical protein A9798_06950 [Edwardsiella hoshinae]|uniref:Uncharacterized protein n=1 Tax=Edwardsiella hoshinae TaxID=93378 RepID=A0ABM6EIH1_9GAMM|nr:hypothetical protein A9798_06950 [Edwardsiella hoshinae]
MISSRLKGGIDLLLGDKIASLMVGSELNGRFPLCLSYHPSGCEQKRSVSTVSDDYRGLCGLYSNGCLFQQLKARGATSVLPRIFFACVILAIPAIKAAMAEFMQGIA